MKVGRLGIGHEVHLGVVTDRDQVLDLQSAARELRVNDVALAEMRSFIRAGRRSIELAEYVITAAKGRGEADWFLPVDDAPWLCPLERPATVVCAGRNFRAHRKEGEAAWAEEKGDPDEAAFPTGFVKLSGSLSRHRGVVAIPAQVNEFDYEVEFAAVIQKPIQNVSVEGALDAVFGYTVFNDLSARDWQRREMRERFLMLGKNFPEFGPLGPWIVTSDEAGNPDDFELELRVNSEVRQHATAQDMIFSISELVAFWSQMGLGPGDAVTSGTPEGVALHHKPDPFDWYLKPGDVVDATVRQIGTLTTTIGPRLAAAGGE